MAEHLEISIQRVNEIVRGKRGGITDTAWLLSQDLETTPEFWMALQANSGEEACRLCHTTQHDYDLAVNRPDEPVGRLP